MNRRRFLIQANIFTTLFDFYVTMLALPITIQFRKGIVDNTGETQTNTILTLLIIGQCGLLILNWVSAQMYLTIFEVRGQLEKAYNCELLYKKMKEIVVVEEEKDENDLDNDSDHDNVADEVKDLDFLEPVEVWQKFEEMQE